MKTLIVEDDFISRKVLENIMIQYGECDVAEDGKEGFDKFKMSFKENKKYDLICLDIMLPEMDGQIVLKEIRKWEESNDIFGFDGVKIIMITALDDRKNIMEAFRSQCEGYIVKPINKKKVVEQLQTLEIIPK